MQDKNVSSSLLVLPFDIRHEIYGHLFPQDAQLYIQALDNELRVFLPAGKTISVGLLGVCRALNQEASEYFYNSHLFNIVGTKQDCLRQYKGFLRTLRKYARHPVHINAFSNGEHSATMCISLQAGDAKMALLNSRRRGQPTTIKELEAEQLSQVALVGDRLVSWLYLLIGAVIVLLLSVSVMMVPRSWQA